jgi:steroid 5-alpha reductase family enzyme
MNVLFERMVLSILINFGVMALVMTVSWLASKALKNAGLVDFVWSYSLGFLSLLAAVDGGGLLARKALLLSVVLPWTLRLGSHLLARFCKEHPHEDKRYAAWRQNWREKANQNMFWVFQFQGLIISVISLPFSLICADPSPLRSSDLIGFAICLVGFIGETIADEQLKAFKKDANNKGKVCSSGLWHFSRHPNYFFEWIIWVGLFVFASSCPFGFYTIYCPVLMLVLLTAVSGVKLTEEHAVNDRGTDYRIYQQTTSAFVPWFKLRA